MKVLVVGTGGAIVSGISTAADQMARTLGDMGHEVERVNAGARMRRHPNRLNRENVIAVLRDAAMVQGRARQSHADLVWIHTFGVPLLPALRALALVLGARVARRRAVVRFHAFGLEDSVRRGGLPVRVVLRVLAAVSHRLVAEHEPAAEALRAATGSSKVAVLHNWVDVPDTPAPMPPMPPLRLVFVGGLVKRKGVHELIEAMRLLGDAPVVLRLVGGAGEDGPASLAALQCGAQDLVESGKVSFAGELDPEGVRAELRAAHVFVLPSKAEGMPLAMLEAMAEGRPVLVADAGNMAAVVEGSQAGWALRSISAHAIADHVCGVLGASALLREHALRAHDAAARRFSDEAARSDLQSVVSDMPVTTR